MTYFDAKALEAFFGDDGGALIPMDQLDVGGVLAAQADAVDDVVESSSFLPRVQLYGTSSTAVKEEKIGQGRFGLVRAKDDIEDLGKTLDCVPLSFRLKAMRIFDGEVITSYDHTSDQFKKIQVESEEQDSGCMFGVEFLLWLPEQGEFVTYFLSSKSSRREAKPLRGLIGKGATIEVKLVKTAKYSWHAPKAMACSSPINQMPDPVALQKELQKFNNPKSSETEVASEEEAAATDNSRR